MQAKPSPSPEKIAGASLSELEALWKQALREHLARIKAEDSYAAAEAMVLAGPTWTKLAADWATLPPEAKAQRYLTLLEACEQAGYATRPYCICCGDCCRQASPSLFVEDAELVRSGAIKRSELYTIRRGEAARLPAGMGTVVLKEELIKVRESPATGHCHFFDDDSGDCRIYHDRPLQCRAQACWDLSDLIHVISNHAPLSRPHIVSPDEPVAAALVAHETRCSVKSLGEDLAAASEGDEACMSLVLQALAYDTELRPLLMEKLALSKETLELLFGRPLTSVVRQLGVEVQSEPDGTYRLQPIRAKGDKPTDA